MPTILEQAGEIAEDAFSGADRNFFLDGDLYMKILRHEVAHQFDRVIKSDSNQVPYSRFSAYTRLAKTDRDWCRASVGNDFFQQSPQEIIASQVHQSQTQATVANGGVTQRTHSSSQPFPLSLMHAPSQPR